MNEYRICTRCIVDTTDREIEFDENGICNHCKDASEKLKKIGKNAKKLSSKYSWEAESKKLINLYKELLK